MIEVPEEFLQPIRENLHDDGPRLILADWLEEQTDPALSAWGEFIRLQCATAKNPSKVMQVRIEELFSQYSHLWFPEEVYGEKVTKEDIIASFIDYDYEYRYFQEGAMFPERESLYGIHTYRPDVSIDGVERGFLTEGLLGVKYTHRDTSRVNWEGFDRPLQFEEDDCDQWWKVPIHAGIEKLCIGNVKQLDGIFKWLAEHPQSNGIQCIKPRNLKASRDAVEKLATSSNLKNLVELEFSPRNERQARKFIKHLFDSGLIEYKLTSLILGDMSGNHSYSSHPFRHLNSIVSNQQCIYLKHLYLLGLKLFESDVKLIVDSKHLKNLETLDLSYNGITDRGAELLILSQNLSSLRVLKLRGNSISQEYQDRLKERFGEVVRLGVRQDRFDQ
ncbi:Hypothetical protein PBC10988_22780 [Planctomycetales bacterium 10988]|nr:Hypothetical protein PBC10988_22780 [Planctomycetales bacterium 10988]